MKKHILCIVLMTLILVIVLPQIAFAEPSDTLKAVYEALIADGSAFSRTQNVYRDSDDGSSLEAVLEDDSIIITRTERNEETDALESETWTFVREGDWLTVVLKPEESAYGGIAPMVLDAALAAHGVNPNLFAGALNAMPELRSRYYAVEESDTETKVRINIVGPYEIDLDALSKMPLTEEHLREQGWTPLGEDYDASDITFGKVWVRCFGNAEGVEISVLEYGELDELALESVISVVKVLQPQGWEAFVAGYTELKDADEADYVAMVEPDDDEELFIILRDDYSTAYFAIGQIDYS